MKRNHLTVSHVSHRKQDKWQEWRNVVFSPKTDAIFVAIDALVTIYEDDLIPKSVTAM